MRRDDQAPRMLMLGGGEQAHRTVELAVAPDEIEVHASRGGVGALDRVRERAPDVVLLDLDLPDMNGMAALEQLLLVDPDLPIVIVAAEGDVASAVRALRAGAFDCIAKPIDEESLRGAVHRALARKRSVGDMLATRSEDAAQLLEQMGPSAEIRALVERVSSVAASRANVLVLGERGSGKELVARAIHTASSRRDRPFVVVESATVRADRLDELAKPRDEARFVDGATVFFDEVGSLARPNQTRLLRALAARRARAAHAGPDASVRVIASSREPLEQLSRDGRFSRDLYHALAESSLVVPALRERPADIAHLARRFCDELARELGRTAVALSREALALLAGRRWEGNGRELRSVVRQAVVACAGVTVQRTEIERILGVMAAPSVPAASPRRSLRAIAEAAAEAAERAAIVEALRESRGNRAAASRALGVDVKTLYRKMRRYGIEP